MCIIVAIPQGKQVSKSTLQRCWNNNPHGAGFMFTDGNKIVIHKEMTSFKRYFKEYIHSKEQYPQSSFVCHFRISTHGKINEDNCHPFLVNSKLGFCHNGIVRNAPVSNDYSDTVMFNETILKNLPSDFHNNLAIMALIQEYIGSGSKLCFLTHDNQLKFVNEKAGYWDNGVWYSNGGYREHNYWDAGGTRVTNYGSTYSHTKTTHKSPKNDYGKKWNQGSMGFASAVVKDVTSYVGKGNKLWEDKLKADKIDNEIVKITKSKTADMYSIEKDYDKHCEFCEEELRTYTERENGCCVKCFDKNMTDWYKPVDNIDFF